MIFYRTTDARTVIKKRFVPPFSPYFLAIFQVPYTAAKFFPSLFLWLLLLFSAPGIRAQTAAEIDRVLELQAVSVAQASRLVLAAAGEEESGAAYALAGERGWLPKNAAADRPIRLGEFSFLIMRAFNIPGSFLYALFPGPRYAFRELDYLDLIPGRKDPAAKVSGERLLIILGRVLSHTGETPTEWETTGDAVSIREEGSAADNESPNRVIDRGAETALLDE